MLIKALDYALQFDKITQEERDIIIHAKRTCLYSDGATWGKTESEDLFDVTMGSWDHAETCQLVGSYMLSLIREKHGDNVGLYRDAGLGAFNATPQEVEKTKKSLCKIFRDNGLKITVEANLGKVNFLDVTLDLLKSSFAPYTKPNNTTVYVHAQSNHPPSIIKKTSPPLAINKRLSELSSRHLPIVLVKVAYYASGSARFLPKLCSNYARFSKLCYFFFKLFCAQTSQLTRQGLKMYFINPVYLPDWNPCFQKFLHYFLSVCLLSQRQRVVFTSLLSVECFGYRLFS